MRLQHLHLLLAIADHGSLRASAEALHVTQPALTKALKQLEDELGVPLVLRAPKGVRLAPAGELLAARAATIVRELERAREEIEWHARHGKARVTVGLSPVAAILIAPGAIARFSGRTPQARLRITDALYPKAPVLVRSGEVDLAIGPLPAHGVERDLVVQPLFESANVIAARVGHPLARAKRLADLAGARWILIGPAGGPGDPEQLGFDRLGLKPPEVRLQCESFSTLLALMTAMDVIGTMPRGFLERYGAPLRLVEISVEDPLPVTTLYAMWRADAPLTPAARRLLDDFVAQAREIAAARKEPCK